MTGLILHHYAFSPFSQKVRSMLGRAAIGWQSVVTREFPPRPVVSRLAGGYRRIPVAQIGADIFCDSRIIAEEIASLSGQAALSLANCDEAVRAYVREVDLEIFLSCIISARGGGLLRTMRSSMGTIDLMRALWDRVQMGRRAQINLGDLGNPRQRVLAHLADAEQRLEQHPWLFGDTSSHADFSAYHGLWFMRDLGRSPLIDGYPRVLAWMDRIRALGEGARVEIPPEQALAAAKSVSPRPVPEDQRSGTMIGKTVRIAPADYARDATTGTLMAVAASRWIIARQDPELGTLHVHFPREGYDLVLA